MLVERALGDGFTLRRESRLCDGLKAGSEGNFDLVILDLSLADSRGYPTFAAARAALPHVPIVILSGLDDGFRSKGYAPYQLFQELSPQVPITELPAGHHCQVRDRNESEAKICPSQRAALSLAS